MGAKELLAAHEARFIEISTLLDAMAEAEGADRFVVARAWRLSPSLCALKPVLRRHDTGDIARGGEQAVKYELLRAASEFSESVPLTEAAGADYLCGEQGFYRDEVAQALRAAGLTVPACIAEYASAQPGADSALRDELEKTRQELAAARARIAELEAAPESSGINSQTLQRILDAVSEFPAWCNSLAQEPNLKTILMWQEAQQGKKPNASRVAHVAHHVIAEHFGLKE